MGDWLKPMPLDTEEFEAFKDEAHHGALFAQAYGQKPMSNHYAWPQVRVGDQQ